MNNINDISQNWIRVIGFGDKAEVAIADIKLFGYDGLLTEMGSDSNLNPSGKDRMVVILSYEKSEIAESTAKRFHQAGVLTVIITNNAEQWLSDSFDCLTNAAPSRWTNIVKGLCDPIFLHGCINMSFDDISIILKSGSRFNVADAVGYGNERLKNVIESLYIQLADNIKSIRKVALAIYFNDNVTPPITMNDVQAVMEFMHQIQGDSELIWGMHSDDDMDCGAVRMCGIVSYNEVG